MKKLSGIIFIFLNINILYANVNVIVSILPQQVFVEKIGGNKVNVITMVKPGSDPHSYEPKPSQMKALSKADIYFPIKIEFENVWLDRFAQHNQKMQFSDMTKGISFIKMLEYSDSHLDSEDHFDPHTWTSPTNVKIMAKNIFNTLVKIDANNEVYYRRNYKNFLQEIALTNATIKKIFSSLPKESNFMVFHPSWGYFAKEYGLNQLVIELEGKEPKPRMLEKIIKKARQMGVKVIFAQVEFSDKSAKVIAAELDIKILKVSPLAKDWSANIIKVAEAIANNN